MMSGILITPKFQIGQKVYHNTADSEEGIVIEIKYFVKAGHLEYLVSNGFGASSWCYDVELTEDKIF